MKKKTNSLFENNKEIQGTDSTHLLQVAIGEFGAQKLQ